MMANDMGAKIMLDAADIVASNEDGDNPKVPIWHLKEAGYFFFL